jgi:amidase
MKLALGDCMNKLHYSGIYEVAERIKRGKLSPLELTRHMLDRIDTIDRELKSFVTVTRDRALKEAEKAEREIAAGNYRGPLHGIPIAIKDLIAAKDIPTLGGLAVLKGNVAVDDAPVLKKLSAAGAILIGKLNMTEGAMAGYHHDFEIPVNPWNADYWSGASSSGSGVSVAAGLCFAALGTDTAGSIRFPAMANGVVGLKPTFGLVGKSGALTLGDSLDHIGPLTRRVADAAIMLETMAGYDKFDRHSLDRPAPDLTSSLQSGVAGMRIGYDATYTAIGASKELIAAHEAALLELEKLGAQIVEVSVPSQTTELMDAWFAICASEAVAAHAKTYPARAADYGGYFGDFLALGATITQEQVDAAWQLRRAFSAEFNEFLASVDALALPSGIGPLQNDYDLYQNAEALQPLFDKAHLEYTVPFDMAGAPGLTVRCGFTAEGMPLAIQFGGAPFSEATLCRIGHAYEQTTSWHESNPPI